METRLIELELFTSHREVAKEAAQLLAQGQVVALPTETVYGLAADAFNPTAVARIFKAKGRPAHDPLIVHVLGRGMLDGVAVVPEEIEPAVRRLTEEFWPGPLTIVLPKGPRIPDSVCAGLPTVAVRAPSHALMRGILKELGRPLAAPSANRFGRISPTTAGAVLAELDGRIPLVIDGGAARDGVESTIIRITPAEKKPLIEILRPGPVTREMLKPFGKVKVVERERGSGTLPEVPGQLDSHYAPRTPLLTPSAPGDFHREPGKRYALLSYRGDAADGFVGLTDWAAMETLSPGSGKIIEAAVRFYALLRRLDELGVDAIVAEPLPEHGVGLALNERLRRARHDGPLPEAPES
jgi:L-threonylcarbamoyladenylate synthase